MCSQEHSHALSYVHAPLYIHVYRHVHRRVHRRVHRHVHRYLIDELISLFKVGPRAYFGGLCAILFKHSLEFGVVLGWGG